MNGCDRDRRSAKPAAGRVDGMSLIRTAISRQVTVTVGVLLTLLFGLIGLRQIPVQLTPEVAKPEITVSTLWPGASPEDVEKELVQRQEDQLKSVQGVVEMKSESSDSNGRVVLSFAPGTDMDAALLKVSNALNRVRNLPNEAERPVISAVNTEDRPIAWLILQTASGNTTPIDRYQNFTEDFVKARFERVPGVARSNVFGGRERELQVIVDPARLSGFGLTLGDFMRGLDAENINRSAGSFDEGKRRYIVRTYGELVTPEQVAQVALRTEDGRRILVGDVAETRFGFKRATVSVRQNGRPSIAINCQRENGANVLEVMAGIKAATAELNAGLLMQRGLTLTQVYDETEYITSAIDLVQQNLVIGGGLAILVLLLFLRSFSGTLIVGTAIPISVIGTFVVMFLAGRSLNVISLAGLAFAVGMVVDNAIVVLENIYRHRQMGKSRPQAALDGTREVWGAVLSSTLTTIAVFLPILFIVQESGQLFRDIAIAICAAVGFSLLVAVIVIPSFAGRIIGGGRPSRRPGSVGSLFGLTPLAGKLTDRLADWTSHVGRRPRLQLLTVLLLTGTALATAWWLAPKPEYLPTGNRNLVIGLLLPPPGYNVEEFTQIGKKLERAFAPLYEKDLAAPAGLPKISSFFYVASSRRIFMGMRTVDPKRIRELIPFAKKELRKVPGMIALVFQTSLFERGLSGGNTVDIEFSGNNLEQLVNIGRQAFGATLGAAPGAQVRPVPSLDLGNPEIRVIPDRVRLADFGLSARDVGIAVDAFLDGAVASKVNVDGDELDLTVIGREDQADRIEEIGQLLLRAPGGQRVPLESVAAVRLLAGPEQINHSERQRTIALKVTAPAEMTLKELMDRIRGKVIEPFRQGGIIPPEVRVRLSGTARKLDETFAVLKWNFILAILITYLLMAALFESFFYPFVIMFSVPLAMAGGFLGLTLVNLTIGYQPLDILTMLGFIILIGTVVNNAILIVHQALNFMRQEGLEYHHALSESVRSRVRPIFMSVLTSVFGMLPLILFPGAGSELYRGLGSVVVGGLVVSTIFTLLLVPALFSLMIGVRQRLTGQVAKGVGE
ncbi:AcrB/AcrD/AcrF family protein [Geothermobacter hydrogeniphilus]|uniref:AcrB/AcrD/AcrF family protein n=2 Tax=Geothermobacter hydrogeniphilus TaxID=1969733 RepID=A0A2K2HBF0_9BACT|nr:AcrB/AcrD/AcrF family protein [Geothermobacter hydrogeniphilus]